ncbi:MAG: hypothetical protein Q7W13_07670 [Bacteroidia bacterium]|nr:hypothetical protein [Bacteroidia bacterium]
MEDNESIKHKLLDYGVKVVLLGGAVYGLHKLYQHYQKEQTEKGADDKPEVRQASTIYSAFNPSGMEWMKKMDGTNTEAVFNTAKEITDLNKVLSAYKKLYNSSMMDDLRQELNPEDYTKFLNTVKFNDTNINKAGNKPKFDFKKGTLLVTKLVSNIRKTPKNISKWNPANNIIKLAEAGKFIGFATGKSTFDNNGAGETGTLFIEVQSVALDTKKIIYYWVAASQLKTISQADYKARKYPFFLINENEVLNGFDVSKKRVIAFQSAPVMDEKFKMIGIASPLQIVGYSIMELDDNKGNKYVKFITPNQQQYWINKKFVQLI